MTDFGSQYIDGDEYNEHWKAYDIAAKTEVDAYRGFFAPFAQQIECRRRRKRSSSPRSYNSLYTPVQIPGSLSSDERPWQARLVQKEVIKSKVGGVVTKLVTPMMIAGSQPDDSMRPYRRVIKRPSLLVTEVDGQLESAELAEITDLICTPAEQYIAAQKAWIERLGAIDVVLKSGVFVSQPEAA